MSKDREREESSNILIAYRFRFHRCRLYLYTIVVRQILWVRDFGQKTKRKNRETIGRHICHSIVERKPIRRSVRFRTANKKHRLSFAKISRNTIPAPVHPAPAPAPASYVLLITLYQRIFLSLGRNSVESQENNRNSLILFYSILFLFYSILYFIYWLTLSLRESCRSWACVSRDAMWRIRTDVGLCWPRI